MPDQQAERVTQEEVAPEPSDALDTLDSDEGGSRLLSAALLVFFIALLLVVAAMTLLPIVLR